MIRRGHVAGLLAVLLVLNALHSAATEDPDGMTLCEQQHAEAQRLQAEQQEAEERARWVQEARNTQ